MPRDGTGRRGACLNLEKRKDPTMLKLNASYSKKVPAEAEFSSQSYHATIEIELPDGLTQDQLNAKIHETFALVRNSVEAELRGNPVPYQTAIPPMGNTQNIQQTTSAPPNKNYGKRNGTASDAPASPKQIKFLLDLAKQNGYTPEQLKAKFNVSALEDLSKVQCSKAIDALNGKAA